MSVERVVERARSVLAQGDATLLRNVSIVAHVDHGKSTLTDCLLAACGLIKRGGNGERWMDAREDEQERTITIKSKSVTLVVDAQRPKAKKDPKAEGRLYKQRNQAQRAGERAAKADAEAKSAAEDAATEAPTIDAPTAAPAAAAAAAARADGVSASFLLNVIDSPGHVDFSSEVTAALRCSDGALVVVDAVEGVCVQTETVLRQALAERVKPVLFVNKFDRLFAEIDLDGEAAYLRLRKTIETVNAIIAANTDAAMCARADAVAAPSAEGEPATAADAASAAPAAAARAPVLSSSKAVDLTVWPQNGSVGFGSGLQQWAFTLRDFARMLAPKLALPERKLMKRLFGDWFYSVKEKRWYSEATNGAGERIPRAWTLFVYQPLKALYAAVKAANVAEYSKAAERAGVKLPPPSELAAMSAKDVYKLIMSHWLPASTTLVQLLVDHLPSPVEAQGYRVDKLYAGPRDDEAAIAMRTADAAGPVMVYISKMLPASAGGRFTAFGRVFSGTLSVGQRVHVLGGSGGGRREVHVCTVAGLQLMMGPYSPALGCSAPAGVMIGIVGVDQYVAKDATITTMPLGAVHPFRSMTFAVAPVVRVAVACTQPAHAQKLIDGLRRMSKADPLVQVFSATSGGGGEHVIAGAGELHLEICVKDLQEVFVGASCPLRVSTPVVAYAETVRARSAHTVCAVSANRHNRLYMVAQPLPDKFARAFDSGEFGDAATLMATLRGNDAAARRGLERRLSTDYALDADAVKKLIAFSAPRDGGVNALVDGTHGCAFMADVRDLLAVAFDRVCAVAPFTGEPLRGVLFTVVDAKLHGDKVHRGDAALLPCARDAMTAALIAAQPALCEPMYKAEITVPDVEAANGAYRTLRQRRGIIIGADDAHTEDQAASSAPNSKAVRGYLPVAESFGLTELLRKNTSGRAFPHLVFSHWELMPFDLSTLPDAPAERTGAAAPSDAAAAGKTASTNVAAIVSAIRKRKQLKPTLPKLGDYHEWIENK